MSSLFQNPAISDVYTEHSCAVNVAKYSPSGFYIASGGMYLQIAIINLSVRLFLKLPF